jgi:hypothetical protein
MSKIATKEDITDAVLKGTRTHDDPRWRTQRRAADARALLVTAVQREAWAFTRQRLRVPGGGPYDGQFNLPLGLAELPKNDGRRMHAVGLDEEQRLVERDAGVTDAAELAVMAERGYWAARTWLLAVSEPALADLQFIVHGFRLADQPFTPATLADLHVDALDDLDGPTRWEFACRAFEVTYDDNAGAWQVLRDLHGYPAAVFADAGVLQ